MKNKKTYYIITIGCQMNKSDSERVAAYLEEQGYSLAKNETKAGLVVLTTCGVRQSAEDRVYGLVGKIRKENPKAKIILTGCLSEREDVKRRLAGKVDVWLPIAELPNLKSQFPIRRLADQISQPEAGPPCLRRQALAEKSKTGNSYYLRIKPKYGSGFSAFVPIGNGCNNFCAYCVVPYARGREVYRPAKEILAEVKDLVKNGYKEIILIAQNVNSYNSENPNVKIQISNQIQSPKLKKINFAGLLKMVNDISDNFWIRFATSHPKDMSDELIKTVAECKKVCKHIHLPVQAGDNRVLKRMNRGYTREDYIKLARKIRRACEIQSSNVKCQIKSKAQNSQPEAGPPLAEKFFYPCPPVSITTDVIVGFPGETKKQFANTVKLFKEIKFDMAYIARYSPRPGTAAYKLKDDVSEEEKKGREEELMKILRRTALENNRKYLGKTVEVLVAGKSRKGEWHGYNQQNKNVKISAQGGSASGGKNKNDNVKCKIGKFTNVKIIKAKDFGLEGEIV